MKIVSKNNYEFVVDRVSRFYDFKEDTDRINADIERAIPADFYENLAAADFDIFTLVRDGKADISFAGYSNVQASETYEDKQDRISISFSRPQDEDK